METYKKVKPMFSQSCDHLLARLLSLLGDESSGAFVDLMQESPTKDYFQNLKTNQFQPEMLMQAVQVENDSEQRKSLPKVRMVKAHTQGFDKRVQSLRDSYKNYSPDTPNLKQNPDGSAAATPMSNYGVSTTTRAKDDMHKSLKLNRISLDSRKSKKSSFARK